MSAATLEELGIANLSPVDLEARRRAIIGRLQTEFKGYDDPEIPESLLNELAVVTSSLRRKTAGPPKAPKKSGAPKAKATVDDLMV